MTQESSSDSFEGSGWWQRPPNDSFNYSPSAGIATENRPVRPQQQQQQHVPQPSAPSASSNRSAVAVACVQCRSRHLKCDGGARCSRCTQEGIQCSYVKSRRGWKGPRRATRAMGVSNDAPLNGGYSTFL